MNETNKTKRTSKPRNLALLAIAAIMATAIAIAGAGFGGMSAKAESNAKIHEFTIDDERMSFVNPYGFSFRFSFTYLLGDHTLDEEYTVENLAPLFAASNSTRANNVVAAGATFSLITSMPDGLLSAVYESEQSAFTAACYIDGITILCEITYSPPGAPISVTEYFKPVYIPAQMQPPVKPGYDFVGWFMDEAFTIPYTNQPITADTKLYAKFTPIICALAFDTNGGESLERIQYNWGETPKLEDLPIPVKEGYTFRCWYTQYGDVYVPEPLTQSLGLVAAWQIATYTITFDSTGGNEFAPKIVNHNTPIGELPVPTREGYTFHGWGAAQTSQVGYDSESVFTEDTTLYAKWSVNTYTVTLDPAGGKVDGRLTLSGHYGIFYSFPTPTREGYIFLGWYRDDVKLENTLEYSENYTATARWEIIRCKVTFILDGETYAEITVDYGTVLDIAMRQEKQLQGLNVVNALGETMSRNVAIKQDTEVAVAEMTDTEKTVSFLVNNTWLLWTWLGVTIALLLSTVIASIVAHKRR